MVLCILLLTEMLDGDLDPEEFELWQMCVSLHFNYAVANLALTLFIEAICLRLSWDNFNSRLRGEGNAGLQRSGMQQVERPRRT